MEKLNVEDIMNEIRHDLTQRQLIDAVDVEYTLDADESERQQHRLQKEIFEVFEHLKYEHELQDYRDMGNGIKGTIKKVIQKMVRLIIVPIVGQQNNYNAYSAKGMELLRQEDDFLREKVIELQTQVKEQEQLLQEYKLQLDSISKSMDECRTAAK